MKTLNLNALAVSSLCLLFLSAHAASAQKSAPDFSSDTWMATDNLGRTTPDASSTRPARKDRFVGIFYFLTEGSREYYDPNPPGPDKYSTYGEDPRVIRDNTQIIKQAGGDPVTRPEAWKAGGRSYWWGEPAVGYFLADDPWVARKNLRMLADAGVDTLIFDVTNGPTYTKAYTTILDTAEEMRKQGIAVPHFMFITYSSTGSVANNLYDAIYSKGRWKDLWFIWQGKPLIFGDPNGSGPIKTPPRPEVQNFFNWRFSWANTKGPSGDGKDEWEWSDSGDPQLFGWHDSPSVPEEESVLAGAWSTSDIGRSFTGGDQPWGIKGKEPPLDGQDMAADVDKGLFFSQQWQNALKTDPQFIFVTGWNEWLAGRQYGPGVSMLGHVTKPGQYFFVDEFNEEFSRDIMPMKGGFEDDYYMQLVDGIRKYKGVRPVPIVYGYTRIKLNNLLSWKSVVPEYRNAPGNTMHRDWPGWGGTHYTNNSGRNDIIASKVACDTKDVYFYVQTQEALTPYTDPNWMQLLIDSDQNPNTGWHGYDYAVNSKVLGPNKTTLIRFKDGKTWVVSYYAHGSELAIAIPRSLLGLTNKKESTFNFHWLDNVAIGASGPPISDWWYDGDSAPDGRFNYVFKSKP